MTDDIEKSIWENGIFCYDANILLLIFKLSPNAKASFLDKLRMKQERTVVPFHACKEFFYNTEAKIQNQASLFSELSNKLEKFEKESIQICAEHQTHYSFETQLYISELEKAVEQFSSLIKQGKEKHLKSYKPLEIQEELINIFEGRISSSFTEEELSKIYKEGQKRYENNVPPGYKDKKNKRDNGGSDDIKQYGDLVIWKHLIQIANEFQKPIIFVSNDQKEDWYTITNGEKKGPRPELRREFFDQTNQHILIVSQTKLVRLFKKYENQDIDDSVLIEELESIITKETQINSHNLDGKYLDIKTLMTNKIDHEKINYESYNQISKLIQKEALIPFDFGAFRETLDQMQNYRSISEFINKLRDNLTIYDYQRLNMPDIRKSIEESVYKKQPSDSDDKK